MNKNKTTFDKIPKFTDFIQKRDWSGAITLLEFERSSQMSNTDVNKRIDTLMWLAYCHFHNNNYKGALELYNEITTMQGYSLEVHTLRALCLYKLGD